VQRLNAEKICKQATLINNAHTALVQAHHQLRQAQNGWSAELGAYLREEDRGNVRTKNDLIGVVDHVAYLKGVTETLNNNVQGLCKDLVAVGRGESFSV
jgi:ubiquinone biosynthesis protein UbiJ